MLGAPHSTSNTLKMARIYAIGEMLRENPRNQTYFFRISNRACDYLMFGAPDRHRTHLKGKKAMTAAGSSSFDGIMADGVFRKLQVAHNI
jgi:hypothetical protein